MKINKHIVSDIFLLSVSLIWGSTFILVKNAVPYISTLSLISLRFILAGFFLIIIFHKKLKLVNKKNLIHSFIIGLFLFGSLVFQVIGLRYTTASNSAFITGLNVIFVPIIASLCLKRKTGFNTILGVILSIIGLFFLTGGINFKFNIGDFMTFLCAICVALQIIFIDKFSQEDNTIILGIFQIFFAGLLSNIIWLSFDFKMPVFNYHVIIALVVTGLLGTAYAFTCQTMVQKYLSASRTALILTAEPVFALIFTLIIPDNNGKTEYITFFSILGCLLILSGMIISELKINLIKNEKSKIN